MDTVILYNIEKQKGNIRPLIPIHINVCRCDNYFWVWNKNYNDFVRDSEIPELNKKQYKSPKPYTNFGLKKPKYYV